MIKVEKVTAVRGYLAREFPGAEIRDRYDSGRRAQFFEVGSGSSCHKVIVSGEFLEDHAEDEIPKLLKRFLLVEHLRECTLPIIVTNDGLKAD